LTRGSTNSLNLFVDGRIKSGHGDWEFARFEPVALSNGVSASAKLAQPAPPLVGAPWGTSRPKHST
jgi:hypothetical protein